MLAPAGVTCEAILLTHGHLDHIRAVSGLARQLEIPVLLHPDDRWLSDDPAAAFGAPPGDAEPAARETASDDVLFSGDLVFAGSDVPTSPAAPPSR